MCIKSNALSEGSALMLCEKHIVTIGLHIKGLQSKQKRNKRFFLRTQRRYKSIYIKILAVSLFQLQEYLVFLTYSLLKMILNKKISLLQSDE